MRLKGDPLPNQVLLLEKAVSFVQSSVVWQSGERQSSQNESSPINTLAKNVFPTPFGPINIILGCGSSILMVLESKIK